MYMSWLLGGLSLTDRFEHSEQEPLCKSCTNDTLSMVSLTAGPSLPRAPACAIFYKAGEAAPSLEASAGSFETLSFPPTGEFGAGAPDGQGEAGAAMSALGVEGVSLQGMRAEGEAPAGEFFFCVVPLLCGFLVFSSSRRTRFCCLVRCLTQKLNVGVVECKLLCFSQWVCLPDKKFAGCVRRRGRGVAGHPCRRLSRPRQRGRAVCRRGW